jgi:PAS domain S-box-containing protein
VRSHVSASDLDCLSSDWSAAFDAVGDLVCLLALDGTIVRCNTRMATFLGIPPDEVAGRKCYELMHGDRVFFPDCPFAEMRETGRRETLELQLHDRWFRVTSDPIKQDGRMIGAVHIVRDVTDFREAAERAEERTRGMQAITELAVDLAARPRHTNLARFLAARLRSATDAVAVAFSEYLPEEHVLATRAIELRPGVLHILSSPLLRRLEGTRSPVSPEALAEITTSGVGVRRTLTEASFGDIPATVDRTVRRLLDIDRVLGVPHVVEGELYGTSVIALKAGTPDPPHDVVQAFGHLAAVSLRQERAELEAQLAGAQLDEFFQLSTDILGTVDVHGKILHVNPAWESILGWTPEEVEGHTAEEFMHPDDVAPTADALVRLAQGRAIVDLVNRQRHKDGTYREIDWCVTPFRGEVGFAIGRDVTGRAEAQRREQERLRDEADQARLLLSIYAQAPDLSDKALYGRVLDDAVALTASEIGFFHLVADDGVSIELTAWNRRALDGCTAPQEGHYPLEQAGNWVDCVRQKQPVIYNDYPSSPNRRGLPDGHSPLRRFLSVPVLSGDQVTAVFGVGNKVSEYDDRDVARIELLAYELRKILEARAAEEEIRRLNSDLERRVAERTRELAATNRDLQEFVYSVAHDLRTPLRAVDGFSLSVLEEHGTAIGDGGRGDLQRVRAAAQTMGELIDALLSLTRVARRQLTLKQVDISAVALRVAEELRWTESDREVEVVIEDGLTAVTDEPLAEVVLQNLLGNAWKFTAGRDVAHIMVGRACEGGDPAFFVRDDGAGFDPAYADKLFVPFQRLHPAEQFPGTGVGLATVARVLDRLGGSCTAESSIGAGATFYFTLGEEAR